MPAKWASPGFRQFNQSARWLRLREVADGIDGRATELGKDLKQIADNPPGREETIVLRIGGVVQAKM